MSEPPLFTCPICELPSWHPMDAAERYCARCGFIDPIFEQALEALRSGVPQDDAPKDVADG